MMHRHQHPPLAVVPHAHRQKTPTPMSPMPRQHASLAKHVSHANHEKVVSHARVVHRAESAKIALRRNHQSRLCMSVPMVNHLPNGKSNWPSMKAAWAN